MFNTHMLEIFFHNLNLNLNEIYLTKFEAKKIFSSHLYTSKY